VPDPHLLLTLLPTRGRLHRTSARFALGLYLLVLVASPLLHHDLACHRRSPVHCQACLAHPPAPRAAEPAGLTAPRLADAGSIESPGRQASPRHVVVPSPGRAPPNR